MEIYAYSPELALEFRRQHRRKVIRDRARKRQQRDEKERPVRVRELDAGWDRAIGFDRETDE